MSLPEFVKKLLVLGQLKWEDGAFFVGGERSVIFRAGLLVELQDKLSRKLGHEEAGNMMKALGREQSRSAFERYATSGINKKAPLEKDETTGSEDPVIRAGQLFLETTGWGKFNYLWFREQKRSVVEVENSPVARAYSERYGKTDRPMCHFLAGLLEGSTGFILGKDVEYVEKECVAQGSKKCIFDGRL